MTRGRSIRFASIVSLALAAGSCEGDVYSAKRSGSDDIERVEAELPAGFTQSVVITGLNTPTAVRFASDGYVFVAEKGGVIKAYNGAADTNPTTVVDLGPEVYNYWDRGLLDIELDPQYPASPYLYALYTLDGRIGDTLENGGVPRYNDNCGASDSACVAAGRLVRLTISQSTHRSTKQDILVENWGQQFPSHSVGAIKFGPDGYLYASAGDAASFVAIDYGNFGNPLGDPPNPAGSLTAPTAMGGSLRAQVITPPARTPAYPTWFNGKVVRLPRDMTPLRDPTQVPAGLVVASGLRNPFRMEFRPRTSQLWMIDVGWNDWEEINRIDTPSTSAPLNFGWPCYEGPNQQPGFASVGLNTCSSLYAAGTAKPPFFAYNHADHVVTGDACGTGTSSITGITFYDRGSYPASYNGALFFADYARQCIWYMPTGTNGEPDPTKRTTFVENAGAPVQLTTGPDGDIYYVDINGSIRRVHFESGNSTPQARIVSDRTGGPLPLTVAFDASSSTDADPGSVLTYAWDLDGDGNYDNGVGATATFTYQTAGPVNVRVRVTDPQGAAGTTTLLLRPGENAPRPAITLTGGTAWKGGDTIGFSGVATDVEDVNVDPARFEWTVVLKHCPISGCHSHFLFQLNSVASGSFVAPAHEYPSYLEVTLKATDSSSLSSSVTTRIDPATTLLTLDSDPPGIRLALNQETQPAPYTGTLITGSPGSVAAPPQVINGVTYEFVSWSDNGAKAHDIVARGDSMYLLARYTASTAANHPPLANAGTDQLVRGGDSVQLDGSSSTDIDGDALTFTWVQSSGPAVGLSSANSARPTFIAPQLSQTADLNFDLTVSDGVTTPSVDRVTISVTASLPTTPVNLASQGTPVALITAPTGGGAKSLEVIRDGVKPAVGSTNYSVQYDTFSGGGARAADWVGYTFPTLYSFTGALFQEGGEFTDGGPFTNLTVQVRQSGVWTNVTGFVSTPGYGANNVSFDTFNFKFDTITGDGIRIYGTPAGAAHFVSVAELEVYGQRAPQVNVAPTSNAGPDQSVGVSSQVLLDGTGSADSNGDPISYAWQQTGGTPVTLSNASAAQPTFTAPAGASVLTFNLTVSDGVLTSAADSVVITVQNTPPVPVNVASQGTPVAFVPAPTGGGAKSLEVMRDGVKPAVGSANYAQQFDTYNGGGARAADWLGYTFATPYSFTGALFQEGGEFSDGGWFTGLTVQVRQGGTWTAVTGFSSTPAYAANGVSFNSFTLKFDAITGDGIRIYGAPGGAARFVSVAELEVYGQKAPQVNVAPTSNAGPDQTVITGRAVTLDGSASADPNGDAITYAWQQVGGPVVTLSNANIARPVFTAPASATVLTFNLVVSDGSLASTADSVSITVQDPPPNVAPTSNAGPDQTVNISTQVTLDGTGSADPNGDAITYAWQQVGGVAVTLSNAGIARPVFTAPAGASVLTFNLTVSDGVLTSAADSVVITVQNPPPVQVNVASQGTPVAFVPAPTGGGAKSLEVMRDGVKPAVGSANYAQQFDTYNGGGARAADWLGYTFATPYSFTGALFQEGGEFSDGGWFTGLTVQVRQGGTWTAVTGFSSTPAYAANGVSFNSFTLKFDTITGDGIRIYGAPGGAARFVSVAELEVYGQKAPQVNVAPTSNAGPDQTVIASRAVTLDGSASADPNGDAITYAWQQVGGPVVTLSNANIARPVFTAPSGATVLTFNLVVSDGSLASTADSVSITVQDPPPNVAPTSNAGPDQTVNISTQVTLDGTGSADPNGDAITYAWQQVGGVAVTLSNAGIARPVFTAPAGASVLTFNLTVSDGVLTSAADSVVITVQNPPPVQVNVASQGTPVALITAPTGGGGKNLQLIRDGVKPAVGSANYAQQYDTYNGGGARAADWLGYTFTTPYSFTGALFQEGGEFSDGGWFTGLTVQVRQGGTWTAVTGFSSTPAYAANGVSFNSFTLKFDTITGDGIRIYGAPGGAARFVSVAELEVYGQKAPQVNVAPTSNAGPDQTVITGRAVTLDGSASADPNGDAITYAWQQVGGTAVTLSNANIARPVFTAPASATVLTFNLVVSDGSLASTADSVIITVQNPPPNVAPTSNAGPDQTVNISTQVTLDGTGSADPNGDALTYAWQQVGGTAVTLSNAGIARPVFTAPAGASVLTFNLIVSDGSLSSAADSVIITVQNPPATPVNLASQGTPVALITAPTGGGGKNLQLIRDGVKPAVGSTNYAQQYDTYNGGGARAADWLGYTFTTQRTFTGALFQEGGEFSDGGWFTGLTVQVRQGGTWTAVTGFSSTPAYAANGVSFNSFTLKFDAITGDGIRIYGAPGGSARFVSVAELEVYGQ